MRAAFHTLGCKTNAYETQAILEQFQHGGYEIGEFSENCDVYVINSCAVTKEAARKSRQMTGRCKRNNPDALVVVTGCYAQEAGEDLKSETLADLVVGNNDKSKIFSLVDNIIKERSMQNDGESFSAKNAALIEDLSRCHEYESQQITSQGDHVRAYVKIQDGCDRFCTYCLIPFLRGRSRSRKSADILREVRNLAKSGYKEIVLTGIDISSYEDEELQLKAGAALGHLIQEIDKIEGIERIRLGSLEAGIAEPLLMDILGRVKSFCPQFHLSLQSGSDTVLKRMNRHYDTEQYYNVVMKIREVFPDAGITTDIITGFPGETEEEFAETLAFANKVRFSRLHVFPYSRREKTRADQMPGHLPKAIKEERARRLIAEGEILRKDYESAFIGRECLILIEEVISIPEDNRVYLAGYTPEYVHILVPIDAEIETAKGQINKILTVTPTEYINGRLFANPQKV